MFYELRRTILDSVNGHHLQRGTIVDTDDDLWVARFGADFKRMEVIAPHLKPVSIFGTEEGSSADKEKAALETEKEPEKEPEAAPARATPKVVKRRATKVVEGDNSDAK